MKQTDINVRLIILINQHNAGDMNTITNNAHWKKWLVEPSTYLMPGTLLVGVTIQDSYTKQLVVLPTIKLDGVQNSTNWMGQPIIFLSVIIK